MSATPARAAVGRADLLRAFFARGETGLAEAARVLGFEPVPREPAPAGGLVETLETIEEQPEEPGETVAVTPTSAATRFPPIPFWQHVATERFDEGEESAEQEPREVQLLGPADFRPSELAQPAPPPIVAWPRLRRALDAALRTSRPRREVDVERLVARWSRGESLESLPRRRGFGSVRVAMMLDGNTRLAPCFGDQIQLFATLRARLGRGGVRRLRPPTENQPFSPPRVAGDELVLALSDLGAYGGEAAQRSWLGAGRTLARSGARLAALVPAPAHRWPRGVAETWSALDWSRPAGAPRFAPPAGHESAVETLVDAIGPAVRVEPGLLRAIRSILGPPVDLGTEVDVWQHPEVDGVSAIGLCVRPEHAPARQLGFARLPPETKTAIARAVLAWHAALPQEIRAAEVLNLLAAGVAEVELEAGAVEAALTLFQRAASTLEATNPASSALGSGLDGWYRRTFRRSPAAAFREPGFAPTLARAWQVLRERHEDLPLPAGLTPEMLAAGGKEAPKRRFVVWHEPAGGLRALPFGDKGKGSPLAEIAVREKLAVEHGLGPAQEIPVEGNAPATPWSPRVESIALVSDCERVTLDAGHWPAWATGAGRDRYGLWASFAVEGVEQTMRWIPPGRFWMGSPETEAGRFDDEGPRRLVTINQGFWLADTPCTQEMWLAVMGKGAKNPSRFQSPRRPVEQVSWEDCEGFFQKLQQGNPELDCWFPTEAEWEYACRAGTEAATWLGDLEIRGTHNAPLLDDIAWYGGNSGKDFELDNGSDSSDWQGKQYDHQRAGTNEVKLKRPNPWGLYDVLGNVWEWCSDWHEYGYYNHAPAVDPPGAQEGSDRVVRGGSWYSNAGFVRAAYRYWSHPGYKNSYLGFRFARGQGRGAPGRAASGGPGAPAKAAEVRGPS